VRRFYRAVSLSLVTVLAAAGCRGGKELERVEVYTQYHGVTFVDKFKIWATGPDEVVARDTFYEPENYIYDGSTVFLAALRGESEAFQLVVNADYGNINDVAVTVAPLVGPGGARISEANVSVYFEYYVTVLTPGGPNGSAGEVPDALPPLAQPFDLAKAQAQPLFVVVDVPLDAKPGKYAGDIVVTAEGAAPEKLTLEVDVLDAALENNLWPYAFVEPDYVAMASWSGEEAAKPVGKDELAPYLGIFESRRVHPFDEGYSQRRLTASAKKAAAAWAEGASGAPYAFFYLSAGADGKAPPPAEMAEEYKVLADALDEGKMPPGVIWAAFEGGSSSPFARGAASAKWWEELAKATSTWPGKPALAAATSPYRGAPGVSLDSAVSYWLPQFRDVAVCPERFRHLPRPHRYFMRADGSGGDVLDGRRAGARLISWYGYLWGAAGVGALAPPADAVRPANPWTGDPMVGTASAYGNGLGCWCYPGEPAGVEGPVSSVRLELLRQGLEDWALFELLEKKRGREYVEERLQALLPYGIEDLSDISSRDLANNQTFELRKAFLKELAGTAPAGREVDVGGRVTDARGVTIYGARVGDDVFATYTDDDGSYRLTHRASGRLRVSASGFRGEDTSGGGVQLYRRLKGLLPVFDFEAGIDGAFWLSGDESDALAVGEERDVVREGRIALAAEFPCGRVSRIVNLYPRMKDFSKHHRFEFDAYNPNGFTVDLRLLLLDDETLDVDRQYRRRVTLRPRAWTHVSYPIKYLPRTGEARFEIERDGSYDLKEGYRLDLTRIIGVGFEADGLTSSGGEKNPGSYKVIIDDVKLVIFE
jgi:hypothetical protein